MLLDTETSGVSREAEVVQVAVVHPSGTTLFEACVRPASPMLAAAAAIHGLTDGVLGAALPYDAVHDPLRALLEGRHVVCFNAAR